MVFTKPCPKTSTHIGNSCPLQDKVENTVVKNKFKSVTQITLDYLLKPTDQ
jgi:hypothetical protein